MSKTAVLVAERDGDWSGWVEPLREHCDELVVLVQRRGESLSELATRARERLEALRDEGDITAAALVGGASFDEATLSARALVVRAIVTQMVAAGGGQLFLDSGVRAGRGRYAMAALASVVEDQVAQTGVEVVTVTGVQPVAQLRRAA